MNATVLTFTLVMASVISVLISRLIPKVSVNYISLIIGAIVYFLPLSQFGLGHFNSELFLGLIVAPLLFFEGQATRLNLVGKELKRIVGTAVVLVIMTLVVVAGGLWWLGGISLPLAFIIAAISTPTDATAMDSVTYGLKMPGKVGTTLKMESLFNDATGIILLNMGILWYLKGYVDLSQTILEFFTAAVGAVVIGFIFAWAIILFRQYLLRSSFNALNAQILVYLLTPFILYFLAEACHVSGIIAVVTAGLVHNAELQRVRLINPPQIHMARDMVSMVTEIMNSMVFSILGYLLMQLIMREKDVVTSLNWLGLGVLAYGLSLIVRYVYGRLNLHYLRSRALVFALGGVHGAVTLALAYMLTEISMPEATFNLVLMAESVLIILSMLVPTIVFRFLLPKSNSKHSVEEEVVAMRDEMVKRGTAAVNQMYLPPRVKASVIFDLNTQAQNSKTTDFVTAWLDVVRHPAFTGPERELEMRAFINAFAQERAYLDMISQSEGDFQSYVYQLYNDVLLAESLVVGPSQFNRDDSD